MVWLHSVRVFRHKRRRYSRYISLIVGPDVTVLWVAASPPKTILWFILLLLLCLDLMLPEDEIIDIKCRPQDRSIVGSNAVNFQENL